MDDRFSNPGRRDVLHALSAALVAAGLLRATSARAAACGVTAATTAGPFYVGNAPSLADINRHGATGTPMRIAGTVFGGPDGRRPLPGAVVEIWHCDADGDYHPDGSGDVSRYAPEQVNLRGVGLTGARGDFRFDSIVPGHYGNRRRHIHWRFVAEGHRPLVTQSYWLDERGTLRERLDFVDRGTDDCRWVRFEMEEGIARGRFDVVLAPIG